MDGPAPAVLTGSTNFTVTDTHKNLNHAVVFHDAGVAAAYQSEFDQLWTGVFGARSPMLTTTDPLKLDVGGAHVQILFSPDNNPELRIVNEITKAQARADLLMFTFAQSTTIDDILRVRLQGGGFAAGPGFADDCEGECGEECSGHCFGHS